MTAEATMDSPPRRQAPFAPNHRWDRNFFLFYVLLIWSGILGGFVPEIIGHINSSAPPYPPILHVHAVAFVGWIALLTTQVGFIRRGRHDLHRGLGAAGMVLAALMVIVGPLTAFAMQRYHWGTPDSDPTFLAIQLGDIIIFAGLAGAAFALRRDPSAHKRLILLATLHISNAGFARFLGGGLHGLFGDSLIGYISAMYPANLLVLGMGAFDLFTRKRLHPVYLPAVAWIAAFQFAAAYLDHTPWWKDFATHLIGH
jgi:hypothetical protein